MITFTEKQDLGYSLDTIMYAVEIALAEEELHIEDLGDHRIGIECMIACGYPESYLCYDNIIDQMKELGFEFIDWNDKSFEYDKSRYDRGFVCNALEALGATARRVYAERTK